jgi:hypothetical protein
MNSDNICGCGKPLIPLCDENKKVIGVTHDTYENEDWHIKYYSPYRTTFIMTNRKAFLITVFVLMLLVVMLITGSLFLMRI